MPNGIAGQYYAAVGKINTAHAIKVDLPRANFELQFGDLPDVRISYGISKTWRNIIKYWLLCKVFPCKIIRWEYDEQAGYK